MKDGKPTPDDAKIEAIINRTLHELGEMGCDSARIFVTYRSDGASNHTGFSKGHGNQWTQQGQIRDWITSETEKVKAEIWKNKADSEEEEDDEDPGDAPKA